MLIEHPRIYLDASGAHTDAILVRDDTVVAVGDHARQGATSADDVVRPDATCLFPAPGDAHIHLWGLGLRAGTVDLRGLDAEEALHTLADATPREDGWIFATNLDEHQFQRGQQMTRRDLDRLFPDQPVRIHRVDRHAIWVNSTTLKRAGIEDSFQPGDGGHVERDESGRPTGLLVDAAMKPVLDIIPETTIAEDRATLLDSAKLLREQGVAFCTIARCPVEHVEMLETLADERALPLHVDALVAGTDDAFETWRQRGPIERKDAALRIGGVKFYADGALGSAGAHLLEPYRQGATGLKMHPEGFLERRIPQLMNDGWQVAVHAIGDAAAREVLDAFERVPEAVRAALRPRLEHAQMVASEDTARFSKLNVIASIQPIHLRSDAPWAPELLHEEQLERLFPWRSLMPATVAAGSDYPIDDLNPWHGIATALTRRGADGKPFRIGDRLHRSEIIAAYTERAAFASHRESELGALHPEFRAEIIALDTDPFVADPDEIWDTNAHFVTTCVGNTV